MSVAEIISLIAAFSGFLAAVGALIASLKNGQRIQEVHLSINSRMDQLVAVTKAAAHAEGVEQERIREK